MRSKAINIINECFSNVNFDRVGFLLHVCFQTTALPGCLGSLFVVPLAPLHSDRNPHPDHLSTGVWVCYVQNNATASSCSNQLGSQVVIGYFLAAGRLTTGIGCNQCDLCAKTFIFM